MASRITTHIRHNGLIFTLTLQAMSAQNLTATYSVPMVPVCVLCGDYDPGKVAGELRPEQQQTVPGGGGGTPHNTTGTLGDVIIHSGPAHVQCIAIPIYPAERMCWQHLISPAISLPTGSTVTMLL